MPVPQRDLWRVSSTSTWMRAARNHTSMYLSTVTPFHPLPHILRKPRLRIFPKSMLRILFVPRCCPPPDNRNFIPFLLVFTKILGACDSQIARSLLVAFSLLSASFYSGCSVHFSLFNSSRTHTNIHTYSEKPTDSPRTTDWKGRGIDDSDSTSARINELEDSLHAYEVLSCCLRIASCIVCSIERSATNPPPPKSQPNPRICGHTNKHARARTREHASHTVYEENTDPALSPFREQKGEGKLRSQLQTLEDDTKSLSIPKRSPSAGILEELQDGKEKEGGADVPALENHVRALQQLVSCACTREYYTHQLRQHACK